MIALKQGNQNPQNNMIARFFFYLKEQKKLLNVQIIYFSGQRF